MKLGLLFFILSLGTCIASESGSGEKVSHGSIFDLKWSTVNFVLLMAFLIYKLRKPLAHKFTSYSEEIKSLYHHAHEKYKEADLKLKMYQEKFSDLDSHINKIKIETEEMLKVSEQKLKEETSSNLVKIEEETMEKITSERTMMTRNLSGELLESIVSNVKSKMKNEQPLQKNMSNKLIASIK